MTIIVDWDVNQQINKTKIAKVFLKESEFSRSICAKFRGENPRKFAKFLREFSRSFSEKIKMICTNLREISRSFLRESSLLRIFVRGMNAKKELFSWADLYILLKHLK